MEELRRLIVGPEQQQLEALRARLDDPNQRAHEVGGVLPDAIALSYHQDPRFVATLSPVVDDVIQRSIEQDSQKFADAIFPVMGPAIRKSITEAFKLMVQSLNTTLDRSLSWQGIKWRLEAARTGRTFAEVAILHSLVFRVEQVFLIHRDTGTVLQHLTAAELDNFEDADLVSAMLTAIRDFARDTFGGQAEQSLDTVKIGELTIWIEQGPQAVLACAVRGTAPETLRITLQDTLEKIHTVARGKLNSYDGNAEPFDDVRPYLEPCLQAKYHDQGKRTSPAFLMAIAIIVGTVSLWIYDSVREQGQLSDYLHLLADQPGLLVTSVGKEDGKYLVTGLRDPLAIQPRSLAAKAGLDPNHVKVRMGLFTSLDDNLVLRRVEASLRAPASVTLELRDGTLHATGSAPYLWIQDTRRIAKSLPGVNQYDDTGLDNSDLEKLKPPATVRLTLHGGTLTAVGSAPYLWILKTRRQAMQIPGVTRYHDEDLDNADLISLHAPTSVRLELHGNHLQARGSAPHAWKITARNKAVQIPGIDDYDDSQLVDEDLRDLHAPDTVRLIVSGDTLRPEGIASHDWIRTVEEKALDIPGISHFDPINLVDREQLSLRNARDALERIVVRFDVSDANEPIMTDGILMTITDLVHRILTNARIMGENATIRIIGHTDSSGRAIRNHALSRNRAEIMKKLLVSSGIDGRFLTAVGVGDEQPVRVETSEQMKQMNRSVDFRVILQGGADY